MTWTVTVTSSHFTCILGTVEADDEEHAIQKAWETYSICTDERVEVRRQEP